MATPRVFCLGLVLSLSLAACLGQPGDASELSEELSGATDTDTMVISDQPSTPPKACGGIRPRPCPSGYQCVDIAEDTCDPESHGADCPGICVLIDPLPPDPGSY